MSNTYKDTNAYKQKTFQWCLNVAITAPNKLSIPAVHNCWILYEIMELLTKNINTAIHII